MADPSEHGDLIEFRLPSLGSDMDSGTVLSWRVAPGDTVHKGDVLVDVDTDKAEIEVEVWNDGVLTEILVGPGTEVPVGTPLARLAPPGSAAEVVSAMPPETTAAPAAPAVTTPDVTVAAEPAAAALPAEHVAAAAAPGGDEEVWVPTPATVYWPSRSTGGQVPPAAPPEARHAAAPSPPVSPRRSGERSDRMRQAIAGLMSRANTEIPHYHLMTDVDLGATMEWLSRENADRPVTTRLLPAAVMLKAVGLAAADHPQLNGFWVDGGFRAAESVNIAVAVHLRSGGLVAPAIEGVDTKPLDEVMEELRDLVARARSGRLRSKEMASATLTVTNLGDQGADAVLGVIHPPQVALVGLGRVVDRATVVDGDIAVRPVVRVTLSADHRATDGHTGARFLAAVDHHLQRPEEL